MKRYDERILNKLLDRYEGSLLYSGKNQVNISIFVPIQKKILPEYFDESTLQFDIIHEQLEQLEEKGYIRLIWKNRKTGHILEKCELVLERTDEIYRLLRRKPRNKKEQEIRQICEQYKGKAQELDQFLDWILKRLDENGSIRKYVNMEEPEEFVRICELIWRILKNEKECFLREFSIRHFHDSKAAEKEIEKAVHIIVGFSADHQMAELHTEEVLEEFNIYRNPSWLMMKGTGYFHCGEGGQISEINLKAFSGGIGLSNQDIEKICWSREIKPEKILTIENLTSFHQWDPAKNKETVLGIYLGGYHNHIKRLFLQQLYDAYPDAEYYHFGDIDCGGFRIWKDLCQKTGIPFRTLCMDTQTYSGNLQYGRELTEQDRRYLAGMMADPFFEGQRELFQKMLKEGKKLEQECVMVKDL